MHTTADRSLEWAMVQALAYHYDPHERAHFIATGTSEKGAATYLTIWTARAIEENYAETSLVAQRPQRQDRVYGMFNFCLKVMCLFSVCIFAFFVFYAVKMPVS